MPDTYTSLHYHIVFGTKNREPWINVSVEQRIWAFLGGIARENKSVPVQIGGVDDHVHLLLGAPATLAPSKLVQLIKGGSSSWIRTNLPGMNSFSWQDGYGAFSVGKSQLPDTISYIRNQREHHRSRTFQEEYLAFLKKHEISFNEKYVLD